MSLKLTYSVRLHFRQFEGSSFQRRSLRFRLLLGASANRFNGKWSMTTNWQGISISGTIRRDGNRIDWSNGTYWIRYRLYGQ
jgi:hypothetical protein